MKLFTFKSRFCSLFIILALTACNNNHESRYVKETNIFGKYLDSLHISTEQEKQYAFICITSMSCSTCREQLFRFFDTEDKSNNIFFITSANDTFVNKAIFKPRFIFDSVGKLDRLNLPFNNVSVVFYKDNQIDTIESIDEITTPENLINAIKSRLNK